MNRRLSLFQIITIVMLSSSVTYEALATNISARSTGEFRLNSEVKKQLSGNTAFQKALLLPWEEALPNPLIADTPISNCIQFFSLDWKAVVAPLSNTFRNLYLGYLGDCRILQLLGRVESSKTSFFQSYNIGNLLDGFEQTTVPIAKQVTWGWFEAESVVKNQCSGDYYCFTVTSGSPGYSFRILGFGDFNADGYEDVLVDVFRQEFEEEPAKNYGMVFTRFRVDGPLFVMKEFPVDKEIKLPFTVKFSQTQRELIEPPRQQYEINTEKLMQVYEEYKKERKESQEMQK